MKHVSTKEFTRVELNRRIEVLNMATEAYAGHTTYAEWELALTVQQRREDIKDLVKSIGDAARDVNDYARKLWKQIDDPDDEA